MTAPGPDSCLLCDIEAGSEADSEAGDGSNVFRDELWAADIAPGYEVPGWIFLRVRRHAKRITSLSDAELDAFGHRARDLVAAVSEVMGTPTTYLVAFGENYPHFHALVIPRDDTVEPRQRSGAIFTLRDERLDPAAAIALVPALRGAYARAGSGYP
jgi:diadenosine tetraphosphate (Ap4A) HIT family hydrolase